MGAGVLNLAGSLGVVNCVEVGPGAELGHWGQAEF